MDNPNKIRQTDDLQDNLKINYAPDINIPLIESELSKQDIINEDVITDVITEVINNDPCNPTTKTDVTDILVNSYNNVEDITPSIVNDSSGVIFIYIKNHGGYNFKVVKKNNNKASHEFDIIHCPVQNLIRFILAPIRSCSFVSNEYAQLTYIEIQRQFLNPIPATLTEDELNDLYSKIDLIGKESTKNYFIDYYNVLGKTPPSTEKKLCETTDNRFTILNKRNDLIINKVFQTDKSLECGIQIIFSVTFKLPDIIRNNERIMQLRELLVSDDDYRERYNYNIGKLSSDGITITYERDTELLACPYFIMYLVVLQEKNLGVFTFDYFDSMVVEGKVEMVEEIDNKTLYGYFQYLHTVVHIDYSCSSLNVTDKQNEFYKKNPNALQNIDDIIEIKKQNKIRGGKRRKKSKKLKGKSKKFRRKSKKMYM